MSLVRMGNCRSKDRQDELNINGQGKNLAGGSTIQTESTIIRQTRTLNSLGSAPSGMNNATNSNINKSNYENVIDSTKAEVNDLLERINQFQGTTENDKNYRYLDEMLTRCILKLDNIECNTNQDRSIRKEAIEGVNQAISILERKLEINSEIRKIGEDLSES